MLDSDRPTHFLNPDTYLNHLSPTEGFEFQVREKITTVLLGAALWDVLAYLPIDSQIVRGSRFSFNIFCFIFSRLFTLSHIAMVLTLLTYKVSRLLNIISGCFLTLAMMTSSFLFLQRVLAIYHENRRFRRCFSIFWLVVALSDIVIIPFGAIPHEIPGTRLLKDAGINPWVTISIWLTFTFDTAVVLAISYKMWLTHRLPNEHLSWYHLVSGRALPQLPRLIFTGGLQYYLIVIWGVIVTGIAPCLPFVPQIYKETFPTMLIFLMASMTSRVFRNVKLFDSNRLFTESTRVV